MLATAACDCILQGMMQASHLGKLLKLDPDLSAFPYSALCLCGMCPGGDGTCWELLRAMEGARAEKVLLEIM